MIKAKQLYINTLYGYHVLITDEPIVFMYGSPVVTVFTNWDSTPRGPLVLAVVSLNTSFTLVANNYQPK